MSFKAYPEAWATHDARRQAAARWQRQGLLLPAQRAAIEAANPSDYFQPVWWLRVGLFIATWFGISSVGGFLALLTQLESPLGLGILALLASFGALELLLKTSRQYHSGIDNALLYSGLAAWAFVVGFSLPTATFDSFFGTWLWLWLLLMLAALVLALLRYADALVAALAFGTALALLVYLMLQAPGAILLVPLVVGLAAVALHIWLRKLAARPDYFYYRSCLLVLRALALVTIYLAGNYLVVFSGLTALQPPGDTPPRVPLAPVFYVFTAVVPLVYIGLGLRRHDRLLLVLGLLLLAFSLFTVRYFYHLLPPEVTSTLGGIVLIAFTMWLFRYLRTPRHGLTAQADDDGRPFVNLESFITLETAHVPGAPAPPGFEFGGGHSGGGGAEGVY